MKPFVNDIMRPCLVHAMNLLTQFDGLKPHRGIYRRPHRHDPRSLLTAEVEVVFKLRQRLPLETTHIRDRDVLAPAIHYDIPDIISSPDINLPQIHAGLLPFRRITAVITWLDARLRPLAIRTVHNGVAGLAGLRDNLSAPDSAAFEQHPRPRLQLTAIQVRKRYRFVHIHDLVGHRTRVCGLARCLRLFGRTSCGKLLNAPSTTRFCAPAKAIPTSPTAIKPSQMPVFTSLHLSSLIVLRSTTSFGLHFLSRPPSLPLSTFSAHGLTPSQFC